MPIGFKRFGKLSRQPTVLAGVAVLAITVLLAVVILALISGPALKSPSSPPAAKPSFTKPVPLTPPPTPKPAPPPVSTAKTLFFDALGGPDRLLTNEYAHWNPGSDCPYVSSAWDMTSGSLFIKNGAGYSGPPTANTEVPCDSTNSPNSAVFRLTTKANNFTNTITSMDFMMQRHGGEPSNSYDGVHIWVRYQSQDALYAVSVSRWDGVIVIKKRCRLTSLNAMILQMTAVITT